jgi:hypothetical protein
MTEIETLRLELNKINSYPAELIKVDCGIRGKGFFPGAKGLSEDSDEKLSNKSVMVLGHDFGANRDYENSIKRGCENQQTLTWSNLNKMLAYFGIDQSQCFFTNCIMGVRTDGQSAIGKSIAYKHQDYLTDCRNLLIKQIAIQKPKLIIALGLNIFKFLSPMSASLNDLASIKSFKRLDEMDKAGFEGTMFVGLPNFKTNLAVITHPTYWHFNVDRRKSGEFRGKEAEKKIIEHLLR